MERKRLTEAQGRLYAAMIAHQQATGRPASLRELADAVGVSSLNAVNELLRRLERAGVVVHQPGARCWVAIEARP